MLDKPITDIIRHVRLLVPDDQVVRAASIMKALGIPELPVINYGRVVGLVRECDLLPLLARGEEGRQAAVSQVMKREPVLANRFMNLEQVADYFSRGDAAVLPVVDEFGAYIGIITRSDVMAVMEKVLRPQTVGGMATPLGVHLTNGSISAGPGNLGLFLTGACMALLMFASIAAVYGLGWLVGKLTGLPIIAMLESPRLPNFNVWDIPSYAAMVLQVVLMGIFLRFSPLAGYHAAEHMVVHTVEQGEILVPEIVKQMPRVHPRCGTNLLVGASMFLIITSWFSGSEAVLLAMIIVLIGWRNIGGWVQQHITTRPPSDKHVANGIKVANELLDKYQSRPYQPVSGFERIRNIGFIQTAAGMAAVILLIELLVEVLGLPSGLMLGL
jgi:CBS domain-containing protein